DADPEKDLKEDPEEDPADYPADGGDDDDESSGDDVDDEDEEEASEEEDDDEEEEHLAPVDYSIIPTTPTTMAASIKACIAEYAAAPTPPSPPPSLLTPLSSPLLQILSPPLPLLSPPTHTSPTYVEAPLGYKATRIRLRAASPLPLPTPSSPLPLPAIGRREDVPEADIPLRKRLCLSSPTTSIRAAEERAMAAIEVLRKERLAYEKESSETRQVLARSEAHNRALEARIATMETQLYR
ncbi:hypothetical protein Tco_1381561, partial [Tanacetum coccineum]